jgi:hypothetical protein
VAAVSVNLKSDAKSPTNPTSDTRQPTPDSRHPKTFNRQQGANSNLRHAATPDIQQSALDIRHPTTNNKQISPTDTLNNQNRQPTAKQSTTDTKKIKQETVRSNKTPAFKLLFPRQTDNVNIFFHR